MSQFPSVAMSILYHLGWQVDLGRPKMTLTGSSGRLRRQADGNTGITRRTTLSWEHSQARHVQRKVWDLSSSWGWEESHTHTAWKRAPIHGCVCVWFHLLFKTMHIHTFFKNMNKIILNLFSCHLLFSIYNALFYGISVYVEPSHFFCSYTAYLLKLEGGCALFVLLLLI